MHIVFRYLSILSIKSLLSLAHRVFLSPSLFSTASQLSGATLSSGLAWLCRGSWQEAWGMRHEAWSWRRLASHCVCLVVILINRTLRFRAFASTGEINWLQAVADAADVAATVAVAGCCHGNRASYARVLIVFIPCVAIRYTFLITFFPSLVAAQSNFLYLFAHAKGNFNKVSVNWCHAPLPLYRFSCPGITEEWKVLCLLHGLTWNAQHVPRIMGHLVLTVCVCVYLCICVCVLPTCECVCAAVFVHKANIYTQWNIIKTLKIYHIMRGVSTGCKRAAAACLSLPPLSLSLSLCLEHSSLSPTRNLSISHCLLLLLLLLLLLSIPLSYACPSKRNSWSFPATQVSVCARVCAPECVCVHTLSLYDRQPAIVTMIDMSLWHRNVMLISRWLPHVAGIRRQKRWHRAGTQYSNTQYSILFNYSSGRPTHQRYCRGSCSRYLVIAYALF